MKLERIHFNTRTYVEDLEEERLLYEVLLATFNGLISNGLFMRNLNLDSFCRWIGYEDKLVKRACMYFTGLNLTQLVGLIQDLHGLALLQRVGAEDVPHRSILTPCSSGVQRVNKVSKLFKKRSLKAFIKGLKSSARGREAWINSKAERDRMQKVLDHRNNKALEAMDRLG